MKVKAVLFVRELVSFILFWIRENLISAEWCLASAG